MLGHGISIPVAARQAPRGLNWLPRLAGTAPALYGDVPSGRYWFDGQAFASLPAWMTAAAMTFSRAGPATDLLPSSPNGYAYSNYGSDVLRVLDTGFLLEGARENLFLDSTSPASQSIAVATGDHTLWVNGDGSIACAAGTAVGTGFGTASQGSPVTFNITGAGTVDFTVTGSLNAAQVEAGSFGTSFVETGGSSVMRPVDIFYAAPSPSPFVDGGGAMLFAGSAHHAGPIASGGNEYLGAIEKAAGNESVTATLRYTGSSNVRLFSMGAGVLDGDVVIGTTPLANALYREAIAWGPGGLAGSLNGAAVVKDSAVTVPSGLDRVVFGGIGASVSHHLYGYLTAFGYWPIEASNAALQHLAAP